MKRLLSASFNKTKKNRQNREESLRWHFLGGNNKNRIGANCGLAEYSWIDEKGKRQQKNILVDAGVLTADPRYPEDPALVDCDTVIPDLTRFLYKKDDPNHKPEKPLDAIFLTHNHADHTGALSYMVLMGYKLPKIYATPYTAKRLEQEMTNAGIDPAEWPAVKTIAPGQPIQEGPVKVTGFSVSHSTPQSIGFYIETPKANIVHPGDFKLDNSLIWGPGFSDAQFNRVVCNGVDLLLLDSTGADRDIPTVKEEDVRDELRDLMRRYPGKRFIISVMSGFEENMASVAKVVSEKNKTLWVSGWSHEQSLSALKETGLSLSDHIGGNLDLRVLTQGKQARDLEESTHYRNVVVTTGSTGKPGAVLTRAAEGRHPALKLNPETDVILFCAPSIPGQEGTRERLINTLRQKGYKVFTRSEKTLYSHAHARLPEILEMAKKAMPKAVIPVHGTKELRRLCGVAMEKLGFKAVQADNGDVVEVTKNSVYSVKPETKDKPRFLGFKTMTGGHWLNRNYLMVRAPAEKHIEEKEAANQNNRRRPKIFDLYHK